MGTPLLGTVISAQVTTGNTDNTFSIGDTNLMQGGQHSYATLPERDAIPNDRRRQGMACWADGTLYRLSTGTLNSDWVAEGQGGSQADIIVEQGTRSSADQVLQNQIYAEQGTRSSADQNLLNLIVALSGSVNGSTYGMLITEQGTRSESDQFLQNQIYVEQGTRSSADQSLMNTVYAEQGTRSSADQVLLNMTYAEQGTRSSQDQFIQNQVIVVKSTADSALTLAQNGTYVASLAYTMAQAGTNAASDAQGNANTAQSRADAAYIIAVAGTNAASSETGTRSSADQFLQNQIYVEQGTRAQADQVLLNLINAFSGSSAGSIVDITNQLAAEAGTRSSADQNLLNLIVTERGTRSTADQVSVNMIEAEASTRSQADGNLQGAIVTEQGTRSSADQNLQNLLTVETGARVAADSSQQNQINSLYNALGVGFSGTFAWWLATTRNGLSDTKLNIINGFVAGVTESIYALEDFEFYNTGSISTFNRGTAWNANGNLTETLIPGVQSDDPFEGYTPSAYMTPIVSGVLNAGTGWGAAIVLDGSYGNSSNPSYQSGLSGTSCGFPDDNFESYSNGTIAVGALNGGVGWNGPLVAGSSGTAWGNYAGAVGLTGTSAGFPSDNFESYSVGAVTSGTTVCNGTGWETPAYVYIGSGAGLGEDSIWWPAPS
jgi:hypothetical protein